MEKNLYEVLGVDKNASPEELKKAYRKKAKENHTDKGGDNEKMVEITRAYDILGNKQKKELYDKTGQTSEESFDKKFFAFMQDLFITVLKKVRDVKSVDIKDILIENVKGMKDNFEEKKESKQNDIDRFEEAKKRLKSETHSILFTILAANIDSTQMEINKLDNDIKFLEECLEVLDRYEYEFSDDASSSIWTPTNRNIFTSF